MKTFVDILKNYLFIVHIIEEVWNLGNQLIYWKRGNIIIG